jgi:Bacterial PH domain
MRKSHSSVKQASSQLNSMHLDELLKIKPYEKIEYVIRRHWITFLPAVGLFLILALIPIAIYFLFNQAAPELIAQNTYHTLIVLLFSVFELSVMLFFYSNFLMYYLDMMIITNDRLIQIQQKTLFSRSVSELDLFKVQDTSSEIKGVVATILGYGRLGIETAGERENFNFDAVPRVNEIRRHLMELSEKDREYHFNTQNHSVDQRYTPRSATPV